MVDKTPKWLPSLPQQHWNRRITITKRSFIFLENCFHSMFCNYFKLKWHFSKYFFSFSSLLFFSCIMRIRIVQQDTSKKLTLLRMCIPAKSFVCSFQHLYIKYYKKSTKYSQDWFWVFIEFCYHSCWPKSAFKYLHNSALFTIQLLLFHVLLNLLWSITLSLLSKHYFTI